MDNDAKVTISRAAWTLMEAARDTVLKNLTIAVRDKAIQVHPDHVQKLMLVVSSAFEEGYATGNRTFNKLVEQALERAGVHDAVPAVVSTKKKPGP